MKYRLSLFWLVLTVILFLIPLIWFILWSSKRMTKFLDKKYLLIKETIDLRKMKQILQKQKKTFIGSEKGVSPTDDSLDPSSENELPVSPSPSLDDAENVLYLESVKKDYLKKINEMKDGIQENLHKDIIVEQKIDRSGNMEPLSEEDKKYITALLMEAELLKNEGKFEACERKLVEGLAFDQENLEINRQLSDLYFTLGNHKKSLSLLKKVTEKDPEDHKSIWQIGEIYFLTGDNETAELLVEKAINLKNDNPKYYLTMVEIYYNTDRIADALSYMEKVIKLRPTNTTYLLTIAALYEEVGNKDNAKKYYFQVLEYEQNNQKAKNKIKELTAE